MQPKKKTYISKEKSGRFIGRKAFLTPRLLPTEAPDLPQKRLAYKN